MPEEIHPGMQVSGQQIFKEENNEPKVTLESDVFGQENSEQETQTKSAGTANQQSQDFGKKESAQKNNGQEDNSEPSDAPPLEQINTFVSEKKHGLADGVTGIADSIREFGEKLREQDEGAQVLGYAAKYGDELAERVESVAEYLNNKNLNEIARDTKQFARNNPTLFVSGAFLLGVLGARFIKSSRQTSFQTRTSRAGLPNGDSIPSDLNKAAKSIDQAGAGI